MNAYDQELEQPRRTRRLSVPMARTRSEQLSRIHSKYTQPEQALAATLVLAGIAFEQQVRVDGIRADVAFPEHRLAVFVDGCFWHGCPEHYPRPRTHADFWADKLRKNLARDCAQTAALESAGWRVLRVWSHEVAGDLDEIIARIVAAMTGPICSYDGDRVICVEAVRGTDDQERRLIVRLRDLETVVAERIGRRVTAKGRRAPSR